MQAARHLLIALGLALAASMGLSSLSLSQAADAPAAAAPAYREIGWDELVPKGWDPLKRFKENPGLAYLNDGSPMARRLLGDMRGAWDNAPTLQTMDGATVKLAGYVVPLEQSKEGLSEFLLVPYFGACIHTPPPPANQIIHVHLATPLKGMRTMDAVWASGRLTNDRQQSELGVSGYAMEAVRVEPYVQPPRR
jgi:hypothetical protein